MQTTVRNETGVPGRGPKQTVRGGGSRRREKNEGKHKKQSLKKIRKEGADPMDEDNDQRKLSAMKLDGIEEGYANMDGLPGN